MYPRTQACRLVIFAVATCLLWVGNARTDDDAMPVRQSKEIYQLALRGTVWIRNKTGSGTGWLVDHADRLIITNHHVVGIASTVKVYFPVWKGGQLITEKDYYGIKARPIQGVVLDSDPRCDLALVQVASLPDIARQLLLAAKGVEPGETIHSVGNPGASAGMWIYSTGAVRQVSRIHGALTNGQLIDAWRIETQSPTNSGDSGSAIVNKRGEVVGVQHAGASPGRANLMNYAIELRELKKYLAVARPLMKARTASEFSLRGERHLNAGRLDAALSDLNRAIGLDARLAKAYASRGEVWQRKNEHDRAIQDFSRAIKLDATRMETFLNRAKSLAFGTKVFDKALGDLDHCILLAPKDIRPYMARADVHALKGDLERAIADLDRCIRIVPNNCAFYLLRARWHRASKNHERAIQDCNTVLKHCPTLGPAFYLRGLLWYDLGQSHRALADLTKAASLVTDPWVVYRFRAKVFEARKDWNKALEDYNSAILRKIDYADAYLDRGLLWYRRKEYDKALSDFTETVRLAPKYAPAHANRAWLLATCPSEKIRHGEQAVKSATLACQLTSYKVGFYLDTLAAAYAEAGSFTQAVKYEEMALRDPSFVRIASKGAEARLRLYQNRQPYRTP